MTEASVPSAALKLRRLYVFIGEQDEREAVVEWLRTIGDRKPHGTDWRTYYEIADAIECGQHRAQAIEAGTAETGTGSACESAVGEADASTILNDICNQSAEALKPLGESE